MPEKGELFINLGDYAVEQEELERRASEMRSIKKRILDFRQSLIAEMSAIATAHASSLHQAIANQGDVHATNLRGHIDAVALGHARDLHRHLQSIGSSVAAAGMQMKQPAERWPQPPLRSTEDHRDLPFPAHDPQLCAHWDREWLVYLATESMYPHLTLSSQLSIKTDVRGLAAREMFYTSLANYDDFGFDGPTRVWCPADSLVNKSVVEIGCGCGISAKQIGPLCNSFLGLDYSLLALRIAAGTASPNSKFLHISDADRLVPLRGNYDTLISREFFIHQNFDSATMILGVASFLLREGGLACCDFFYATSVNQPGRRDAKSPTDPDNPSSGFHYTDDEIRELAQLCGYDIESSEIVESEFRRFVLMRKRPAVKGD